jgi:DNA-binding SARP family transcriptional activator
MLSVSLLGDFLIRHDDTLVTDIDTPRLQSLLAYLILNRGTPQPRSHLAFLFWPDTTEAQARTNLRNLLHHLRHALPNADCYLYASVQTLQWQSEASFALDVANFESALAHAQSASRIGDSAAFLEALECAVAIYKGDLLSSCYDDWIIPYREGLRQAFLDALEQLVDLLEGQRDYQAAIRNAQRLLRYDPLHEATYRRLIRLHALNADRAGALRIYHTCTTVLQRELEVEPSAATREAYEQLLGTDSRPNLTLPMTTAFSPLVGRDSEWTQMLQAWRSVVADRHPHVLILSGEAGIGKTRLAEELLQWAARQGIDCASARCYAAEGELAYSPVIAWLRAHRLASLDDVWLAEVARLLPEVLVRRPDLPRPAALTEAWQRERLFEALSHAILGLNKPLLLVMDDLQWCDRDTLEFLHFLIRFDREARLLIVGAYRPEEIGENHPLLHSIQVLRLDRLVTELDLGPLDKTATQILAERIATMEISLEAAQLLYRETEGNPLFVVETVRAGLHDHNQDLNAGTVSKPAHDLLPGEKGLPPRVQSVLEYRLAQVSPPSRELVGLAATIGREFNFKLLAKASGCEEDILVRELDELWQRRIVREQGTDAYDFSHDKLREVAYRNMSEVRRRLLHRQTAHALETLHAAALDSVSQQVADHYERAGLPEQAAPYYLRAAGVARKVYANEEAITLLQRGLALAEKRPASSGVEGSHEVAAKLWEALGDILELKVQHENALQAYRNAQVQVVQSDSIWQARLQRKTGIVMREQRLYTQALDACHRAELALGSQPDQDSDAWWDEWLEVQVDRVWAHYWLAQWPEMETLVNKVQPAVQVRGKAASRSRFLMASILMHLRRERYIVSDEMLADSRESLALSRESGDMKTRIDCQFELGFLHLWRRELDEAEENLLAALELVQTLGSVPMRTLTLTYLTVLYRFRGMMDGVFDYAQRAQKIAEAAQMPDYVAAAKGNQAWIAWRRHDLPAAEQWGQEALAIWRQSPLVYPFQWFALWPLIAVALEQGREDDAWNYVKALVEPTQQLLQDELNTALEAAVQAKARDQAGEAPQHLVQTLELAQEMGYL